MIFMGRKELGRVDTITLWFTSLVTLMLINPIMLVSGNGNSRDVPVHLTGTVVNDIGAPLNGTLVIAIDVNGAVLGSAYANTTGAFVVNIVVESGNVSLRLVFLKEGFFRKVVEISHVSENESLGSVTLIPLPAGTEDVIGQIRFSDGAPVSGAKISMEYEGPEGTYSYETVTGIEGNFSFTVFPAVYNLRGTLSNVSIVEEELEVLQGEGPYFLDFTVGRIPDRDSRLMGYVTSGGKAVAGAVVGLRNMSMEMGVYTTTRSDGFFELQMWEGEHMLFSMKEGFDVYITSIALSGHSISWMNISIERLAHFINGTVRDEGGSPLKDITVQFARPHSMGAFGGVLTDEEGMFSIMVPTGSVYLMAMMESPFEDMDMDVFFKGPMNIDSDTDIDSVMHPAQPREDFLFIEMENFSFINPWSVMTLSSNGSKAARVMIDSMAGNGDLVLTRSELERFTDALMRDDGGISDGHFGRRSDDNFTVAGNPYILMEDSIGIEVRNATGPVDVQEPLEIRFHSSYEMEGELPESPAAINLSINGTYSGDNEESTAEIPIPEGWRLLEHTPSSHNISLLDGKMILRAAHDPDPEDDKDYEWVTITFVNDSFEIDIEEPEYVFEGEPCMLSAEITDHVPGNERYFTWEIQGGQYNTTIPEIIHEFPEDGKYDILLTMTDGLGRRTVDFIQLEVFNRPPNVTLIVEGGLNQTFNEGSVVRIELNATDVPADPLHFRWNVQGEWGSNLTYDSTNMTMDLVLPDDGNISVAAMVFDDDGGSTYRSIVFPVTNIPPYVSVEMKGLDEYDLLEQGKWLEISLNVSDVPSDNVTVKWELPDMESVEREGGDYKIRLRFLEAGDFEISLIIHDEDGGYVRGNWTIQVSPSVDFDNDGDGMPRWWEILHELDDDDPSDASGDGDLDSLSNLEEYENGTDPWKRDTDGDGIPDDHEIKTGTNPILDDGTEDPDGDGISNLDEYLRDSDPLDPNDPGKKEDSRDTIYLLLFITVSVLVVGIVVLFLARRKGKNLLPEE